MEFLAAYRVKKTATDQIVKKMQEKSIPVIYVVYNDEGHMIARTPNLLSMRAITEQFLAKHLGGHFEPIGDDFESTNFSILAGSQHIE